MASSDTPVDKQTVEEIIADWPEEPAEIAETMMDAYGMPHEVAPSELLWYGNGQWKRTELYRDGVPHHFPKKHTDYLKQVVDYHVPPGKFDDLGRFDGSVYVDRTNGELAAKCDQEIANVLALNLAHDVITDETSVDEARQKYATTMIKVEMGEEPEYTKELQFDLPSGDERDPDETIIDDDLKAQVKEQMGTEAEGE